MSLTARSLVVRTVHVGLVLSFVGAKGCLGGDVSLGNEGTGGGVGATGSSNPGGSSGSVSSAPAGGSGGSGQPANSLCQLPTSYVPCPRLPVGYNFDPTQGKCVPFCSANAKFASLDDCQRACDPSSAGGGGGSATEAPLTLGPDGSLTSSAEFDVSASSFVFSDGVGPDGSSATGDCELAGHSAPECAKIVAPPFSAPGVVDWSVAGPLCTSGSVEKMLDVVGMPGMTDYASMWGAGIGVDFKQHPSNQPYDASAHGVVGIAFDIDRVPPHGLRVALQTPTTINESRAWQPTSTPTQNYTSPVQVGHNVVLFRDVVPLPFFQDQSAFDPTKLSALLFHAPSTNTPENYVFCVSNLSLILGTPDPPAAPADGSCAPSLETETVYPYDAADACISSDARVRICSASSDASGAIPSQPAIVNVPCARRSSDGALYVALKAGSPLADWQALPMAAWAHLSPDEWADCTADEAALVAAAPVCPINAF